jgi:hypothetical protein
MRSSIACMQKRLQLPVIDGVQLGKDQPRCNRGGLLCLRRGLTLRRKG